MGRRMPEQHAGSVPGSGYAGTWEEGVYGKREKLCETNSDALGAIKEEPSRIDNSGHSISVGLCGGYRLNHLRSTGSGLAPVTSPQNGRATDIAGASDHCSQMSVGHWSAD
jgi:hypothetical protein